MFLPKATTNAITISTTKGISGTSGSILFIDSSGNINQNNANFFWDNTNNRLGIGTASPGALFTVGANSFQVDSSGRIGGFGTAINITRGVTLYGSVMTSADQVGMFLGGVASSAATGSLAQLFIQPETAAAAFTVGTGIGIDIRTPTIGAGSAITTNYGIIIRNQGRTGITNAVGLQVDAQSGASSTNYAAIFAGGNVGIGTASPTSRLVVGPDGQQTELQGNLLMSRTGTTPYIYSNSATGELRMRTGGTGKLIFQSDTGTGAVEVGQAANIVNFQAYGNSYLATNSGNVGIGTASPAAQLHIGVDAARPFSINKSTLAVVAPGAGVGLLRWETGTNAGTLKLVAYTGTSTTGTTIVDNVGAGN